MFGSKELIVRYLLYITYFVALSLSQNRAYYTLLDIDLDPCRANKLLRAYKYFCDDNGKVFCHEGWGHDPHKGFDPLEPCPTPQCEHGCVNGVCTGPGICSCYYGWHGRNCSKCVPLPGCRFGSCDGAMTCNCQPNYEGAMCDIPICDKCVNGVCVAVNVCSCDSGWKGQSCEECIPAPGCLMGGCRDNLTNTCQCVQGFEGRLCDTPVCNPACNATNGECQIRRNDSAHICVCKSGYMGDTCDKCQPYWNCPNQGPDACRKPNDCLCNKTIADPNKVCDVIQ